MGVQVTLCCKIRLRDRQLKLKRRLEVIQQRPSQKKGGIIKMLNLNKQEVQVAQEGLFRLQCGKGREDKLDHRIHSL